MIKIKTPIKYKYYVIANYHRTLGSIIEKTFLAFFALLFIASILLQSFNLAILAIIAPVAINLIFSFFKYIYAKAYFKIDNIEYFFDSNTLGYTINEAKVELKKKKIQYIKTYKSHILVKFDKQNFYIVGETELIQKATKELLNSGYVSLIRKKEESLL